MGEAMTKTLAELEPLIIQWAEAKGLIKHTVEQALAQHGKTEEEVGELLEAIAANTKAAWNPREYRNNVRLEAGDVLVTLIIQSAIQGCDFSANLRVMSRLGLIGRGSLKEECDSLGLAISRYSAYEHWSSMARVALSLKGLLRPHELTLAECLEAAWEKIRDRTGQTIDGVFVKDNP